MDDSHSDRHLTDADLFSLAAPAAGEPEALPAHLSRCADCSRALREWKGALRSVAEAQVGEIDRRTAAQWREREKATMAAILRVGRPGRRKHPIRWAIGIAASLLVVALAMPRRSPAPEGDLTAQGLTLSAADAEDDELLRDVAYLARGGDEEPGLVPEGSL